MSNIIKSSQIIGEYLIKDRKLFQRNNDQNQPLVFADSDNESEIKMEKEAELILNEKEVEKILDQAKKEAAEIINRAEKEAIEKLDKAKEKGYSEGYEKGYQAGQEEGYQEGLTQIDTALKGLEGVILKTKEELAKEAEELAVEIIKLAIRIAGRIVNVELELNPQFINNIVLEMVQDMSHFEEIHIRVNPKLLIYLDEKEFKERFSEQGISFMADSSLKVGDCIVESDFGGRDGSLENKLKLLEKGLLKGASFYEEA